MLITHDDARRALAEVRAYRDLPALDTLAEYIAQQEARHDRRRKYHDGDEFVARNGERRRIVKISEYGQVVRYESGTGVYITILMKSFTGWVNDRGAHRVGDDVARPAEARG